MSHSVSGTPFSVCVEEFDLEPATSLSASELESMLDSFLSDLLGALSRAGCLLIGHIKGVAESNEGERVFFSVTDFGQEPSYQNGISSPVVAAHLTLNTIVVGLDDAVSRLAVAQAAVTAFGNCLVTRAGEPA